MPKPSEYSADFVRDISVEIYKVALEDSSGGGKGAVKRMIEGDGNDGGKKLRGRAQAYDRLTRFYLSHLKQPVK